VRIRTIKPELWSDALTGEWDARRTLFYVGLWQVADDSGRLRLDPRLVRAELDPFDTKFGGAKGVADLLEELVRGGRLLVYEADGHRLALLANFAAHQVINKPTKSRLPPPPEGLREDSGRTPGSLLPKAGVEGKGREGKGRELGREQGGDCAEPVAAAPAPAPASPAIISLRCAGKGPGTFDVTQRQLDEWSIAFPGVDVLAEIRKSAAWQDANAARRKTAKGMAAHLVSWLSRAQDGGRVPGRAPAASQRPLASTKPEDFESEVPGGF
jgi:hypothetical protein